MCDATGQRANGLQLLYLVDLSLQFFLFINISQINHAAHRISIAIMINGATDAYREDIPGFSVSERFNARHMFSGEDFLYHFIGLWPIFFRNEHVHFLAQTFPYGPSKNLRKCGVQISYLPFHVINNN